MARELLAESAALSLVWSAWLLAAAGCTGIGLLWQRAWRTPLPGDGAGGSGGADRLAMAFWIGLALAIAALQVWHFALPVGPAAAAGLLGIGLFGLVRERSALSVLRPRSREQWLAAVAAALGLLWLAHRCLRPLEHYDTGLYLLGALTWLRDAPLVPGLANLHGRFGFNNAHLLFAALFDAGPWTGRAPNLVNGCLLAVFLAGCAHAGSRLFRGERAGEQSRAGAAFACMMVPPALMLAARYLVSLSTDLPATLLSLLVAWRVFRLLAGEVETADARRAELRDVTLLCAAGVCVKLSALVFLGGVWLLAVLRLVPELGRRDAWAALAIGAAVIFPWLARGAVLSGYPLYPSTLVSLPVGWRVPAVSVENEALGVKAWARVPGVPRELTLKGWYWLESWLRRNAVVRVGVGFPLPVLLGGLGVFLAAAGGSLGRKSPSTRALWLFVPSAIAFAFWFWMAPDPRFAMFVFWSMAAAGVAAAVGVWGDRAVARLGVAALAAAIAWLSLPRDAVHAGPEHGFHPVPRVRTELYQTASGLALRVPVGTDKCWAARQPCTPHRRAELRLRSPGHPRSGFTRGASG